MKLRESSQSELKHALARLDELLADDAEFEKWVDRVVAGWRKKRSCALQ